MDITRKILMESITKKIATNPLIVANIMRNIKDWEDLASCRKVNHLWNKESKRKSLSTGLAALSSIDDMEEYINQWTGSKGYCKFKMFLYARWFETKKDRRIWTNFFHTFGPHIEELSLYITNDSKLQWDSILAALPHLTSLKNLNIDLSNDHPDLALLYFKYFGRAISNEVNPDGTKCLSVKEIKISTKFPETHPYWSEKFSEWLLTTFPNVEDFDTGSASPNSPSIAINYLEKLLEDPTRVRNLCGFGFSAYKNFSLQRLSTLQLPLKSLRFDIPKNAIKTELKNVLEKFSPTLELLQLTFTVVLDNEQILMSLPVFPKLKELSVRYTTFNTSADDSESDTDEDAYSDEEKVQISLSKLSFHYEIVPVIAVSFMAFNYGIQFPALESLTIKLDYINKTIEEEIYNQYFPKNAICKTVKHLRVSNYDENHQCLKSRLLEVFPNAQDDLVLEGANPKLTYI